MRIFKNARFDRFARKEGISDKELKAIVEEVLEEGLAEADLGGGVYKVRVARPGEGKSGGYRVIVLFRSQFRTFFVYGFEKSARANIDQSELRWFKSRAKEVFFLTDTQVTNRLANKTLLEILEEAKDEVQK